MPERRLLLGVISVAADDVREGSERERREAVAWFLKGNPSRPFSFPWICAMLDLNAEMIRRRLGIGGAARAAS